MSKDPLAEWGIIQGGHVLGVSSPCQYLASLAQDVTADVSGEVRADALLLAGADDHYVPLTQLADQIHTIAAARSVTARVFTRDEQAQNHVQAGNIALSMQVILDWLDSIGRRDSQPGLTS
jgi:4-diphosphocytidyl-2C-methyl-D-erythritol kinase